MKYEVNRWNKNRISYIHFGYADFHDFDSFALQIMENLKVNIRYSVMLKVNFNEDRHAMLGKQMGFKYSEEESLEKLEYFHSLCKNMVNNLWDDYDVDNIKSIQILYVLIADMPKLELRNVNKVNFNRDFTNTKKSRERFNLIPLTLDTNYYGKLIINTDAFRSLLNIINDQRDHLNKDKLSIDENSKMYLYNDSLIIISVAQNNNTYYRGVYDAKLGVLIHEIKDVIVSANHFIRTIGNTNLTIINDSIVKVESVKVLSPITYKDRSLKDESNPFIGSWDVEAFEVDGYAKVYALGFKVLNKESVMYYMKDGITSDELVLQCINDMLVNEYNGYTFYTHNFGKYDSIFLIKILKEANIKLGYEHYITKELDRGGKMLKLVIKVKRSLSDRKPSLIGARKDPGYNTITIVDSLNILNQSLADLCSSFGVEVVKGHFPYSFVKSNTLHYVGNTPEYKHWEKISLNEYNKLVKSDWNLKEECLKYLDKDLSSLVLIMNKFSEYINRKYYLQVTDSLTISRLALNIFMKDYLKDSKLPLINKNMFSDIKRAYYGGVTEVYKPYGKNLLHYDVNSLYPFAALNPMPGIKCTFIENLNSSIDIKDLFGFFYCEIKTGDNYLGLLPVHHEEGMIMPNGTWKGWYFSEELKYAAENGYVINVIKGYNFDKVHNVFTDYVKDLYKIKSSTNDRVEKDIAKRLLNHLLGRFGLNINKPVTKYVNADDLSLLFSTREILGRPIKITNNDYKVTYNSQVDPDICTDHGIDYIKVQNLTTKTDIENVNEFKDVSLSTAAAVTAYARIYMSKIKLDILNKGGKIYYTDTDSIVTDIPLDNSLVGDELGQFKLEYKIKQGYYISNKTYYIDLAEKLWDKRTNQYVSSVIKSKTVDSKSLSLESFKSLYNNKSVDAIKRSSIRNYDKGSVLIVDQGVKVSHDAFTKREKLYKGNKWVDTKPLTLDGYSTIKKKDKPFSVKRKGFVSDKWLNMFLDAVFGFIVVILSFTTHSYIEDFELNYSNNETTIDLDLEKLIELRYNDDYLEEPIEMEYYVDNHSKSWLKSFFDLFMDRNHYTNNIYNYFNDLHVYQDKGYNEDRNLDNIYFERPQVLSSVLRSHIESLCNEISDMKNAYSVTEVHRLSSEVKIEDAIDLCKKALRHSPISDTYSPIFERYRSYADTSTFERLNYFKNSPSLHLNTSFENTPVLSKDSPIIQNVTAFGNSVSSSPSLHLNTSFESSPMIYRNSPLLGKESSFLGRASPLLGKGSPFLDKDKTFLDKGSVSKNTSSLMTKYQGHSYNLSGDTAVYSPAMGYDTVHPDNCSICSDAHSISPIISTCSDADSISPIISTALSIKQEGLFIDILNFVEKGADTVTNSNSKTVNSQDYIVPRKYPIRDIESASVLKRYGNIWSNKFNIESPSTIKRYGWVSPNGTSVLEEHSPLAKRYGNVFSDEFTLKKDYHLITENNGVYKPLTPSMD